METIALVVAQLLNHLDDDPEREGLTETPQRYQKFLNEFLHPQDFEFTVFENEGYNEMVVQANIPFYSICEHHLLPFFGFGTIAYLPDKKIVGLSKLPRTLEHFSHKLQNQERITVQVANFIDSNLKPKGVGVTLTARHMCMEMRGIRKQTQTSTSCLKGLVKSNPSTREEYLRLQSNKSPY